MSSSPDCTDCEAPCCRRQFMSDDEGWYRYRDARPIYLEAGADVRIVGWAKQPDGRQPMLECTAFDTKTLRCGVYETRPEHCRTYDCREDARVWIDYEKRIPAPLPASIRPAGYVPPDEK